MSLKFYFHPLASFCWKPLVALYENGIEFEPIVVNLADPDSAAAFRKVWPAAKFPVMRDEDRDATVAESTIVIEYLDAFHPGPVRLIPDDANFAWQVRMWDRFFDFYVHDPMQRIVADQLRAEGDRDPFGVKQTRQQLRRAYDILEEGLADRQWAAADRFSLADCSAFPALFYANTLEPLTNHPATAAYLTRLMARPCCDRVLAEAEPFFQYFPLDPKPVRPVPGHAGLG